MAWSWGRGVTHATFPATHAGALMSLPRRVALGNVAGGRRRP
ncbi:MAG TPA: hypothetical protein VFS60_14875 [Thermoanaerobaculia bacterium]|nr:hypothetical protein [Thermoanaerobaculia bacterium]